MKTGELRVTRRDPRGRKEEAVQVVVLDGRLHLPVRVALPELFRLVVCDHQQCQGQEGELGRVGQRGGTYTRSGGPSSDTATTSANCVSSLDIIVSRERREGRDGLTRPHAPMDPQ